MKQLKRMSKQQYQWLGQRFGRTEMEAVKMKLIWGKYEIWKLETKKEMIKYRTGFKYPYILIEKKN